jgi:hypothetical protein
MRAAEEECHLGEIYSWKEMKVLPRHEVVTAS